jgi:hypothetical protein
LGGIWLKKAFTFYHQIILSQTIKIFHKYYYGIIAKKVKNNSKKFDDKIDLFNLKIMMYYGDN